MDAPGATLEKESAGSDIPESVALQGTSTTPDSQVRRHQNDDDDSDASDNEGEDEEEEEESDEEEEEKEEDEEPRLKYAYLTKHLKSVYRSGDATSCFLAAGDKMVYSFLNCWLQHWLKFLLDRWDA